MSILDFFHWIYSMWISFYNLLNSIIPFSDFPISLFWILAGLVGTRLVWGLFPHEYDSNFGDSHDDDE